MKKIIVDVRDKQESRNYLDKRFGILKSLQQMNIMNSLKMIVSYQKQINKKISPLPSLRFLKKKELMGVLLQD